MGTQAKRKWSMRVIEPKKTRGGVGGGGDLGECGDAYLILPFRGLSLRKVGRSENWRRPV